jgi:hypothetical protein
MYNVIAIFPRILEMSDVQAIKYLAEAKTVKRVKIELSDIVEFCRIALGAKDLGEMRRISADAMQYADHADDVSVAPNLLCAPR